MVTSDANFSSYVQKMGNDQPGNTNPLKIGNQVAQSEEDEYPPLKVVIPTVLCIYMSIFLAALVGSNLDDSVRC
jgi:hypothetical protein